MAIASSLHIHVILVQSYQLALFRGLRDYCIHLSTLT